jgi:hypothetical protein
MRKILIGFALILGVNTATIAAEPIPYPEGYRYWAHVKSMAIHPGHPLEDPFLGIHHVYANEKALEGLKTGRYADGAVLVFDQLEFVTEDHASTEGDRVLVGVMVKDAQRFADTGGWGFEAWEGDSRQARLVEDGGAGCYGCHTQKADRDYVFSEWRD